MPSFVEIVSPRFLKGFNIYGYGGHLGHVTCIIRRPLKSVDESVRRVPAYTVSSLLSLRLR